MQKENSKGNNDINNTTKINEIETNKENSTSNINSNSKNLNKKRNKVIGIIAIILFIIIIILIIIFKFKIIKTNKSSTNSLYVSYNERQSYIIKNVSDSLLTEYQDNKDMLIVCMATWCTNCKEDADAISEFIKQNPDVEVIIVAQDPNKSDVETYLKETNRNWFVIFDPNKTIRAHLDPEKTTIPNTYLINKKGEVTNKYEGTMTYDQIVSFYHGDTISSEN